MLRGGCGDRRAGKGLSARRPGACSGHHAGLEFIGGTGGLCDALRRNAGRMEVFKYQGRRVCGVFPCKRRRRKSGASAGGYGYSGSLHAFGYGADRLSRRGAGGRAVRRYSARGRYRPGRTNVCGGRSPSGRGQNPCGRNTARLRRSSAAIWRFRFYQLQRRPH